MQVCVQKVQFGPSCIKCMLSICGCVKHPVALCIYRITNTHTHTLCSSCATPPRWRPTDGTGLVSVCSTEVWYGAGYSRSSLEHTQVLFFYHSPYVMQRQHPQAWLPIHSLSDGAGLIISSFTVPGDTLLGHCLYATHISNTFHAT